MNKPDLLRQHLLETVPELALNPDRLSLSLESGRTALIQSKNLGFEYRYNLTIAVSDFKDNLDAIMVPLLAWLARFQPDRLRLASHEALTFDVQSPSTGQINATIVVALTEQALVEVDEEGRYTVTYVPEPDYDPGFAGVPDTARLWTLMLGGTTVFDVASEH